MGSVKQANETLGINVPRAINFLADTNNREGLRAILDIYERWENGNFLNDTTRQECVDRFYLAAQIGDCLRIAGGGEAVNAIYTRDFGGYSTAFFRDVIDYVPPFAEVV